MGKIRTPRKGTGTETFLKELYPEDYMGTRIIPEERGWR